MLDYSVKSASASFMCWLKLVFYSFNWSALYWSWQHFLSLVYCIIQYLQASTCAVLVIFWLKIHSRSLLVRLPHSDILHHFSLLLVLIHLSLPLSFPEMLPCRRAIRSDHYFEAQTGCLDTGFGDEFSRRAGSSNSSFGNQDRAVGLVSLSSSPQRLGLLCCFLRCSGWLKCLADRPLLKTYPSMASDLWRMRSYTLIQRAAWRGASRYEFCQQQQREGQQKGKRRDRKNEEEKKKKEKPDPPSLVRDLKS